jgi:hypothetical protein
MVDADGALSHHLLEIPKTERIGHIPSHAQYASHPADNEAASKPWQCLQQGPFVVSRSSSSCAEAKLVQPELYRDIVIAPFSSGFDRTAGKA